MARNELTLDTLDTFLEVTDSPDLDLDYQLDEPSYDAPDEWVDM